MIAAPVTFQSYKIMIAPSKEELLLLLLASLFFSVAMSMIVKQENEFSVPRFILPVVHFRHA